MFPTQKGVCKKLSECMLDLEILSEHQHWAMFLVHTVKVYVALLLENSFYCTIKDNVSGVELSCIYMYYMYLLKIPVTELKLLTPQPFHMNATPWFSNLGTTLI